ncbi:S-layer homology domain-containing protein [Paenibacillus sp. FSL H3-0333]|uniref:S-layer homology domain-containing protein n=1 Tax=Paenibacillus sp. FSL H3-0333 TaxID=2921373 RepID=UPI0030F6FEE6
MFKKTILFPVISMLLLSSAPSSSASAQSLYSDVNEQKYSWAMESILFMTDNDVLKGYSDGTFKPEATVTKAEFTVMLHRLFDKYRPNVKPLFYEPKVAGYQDVPTNHWAYKEITELYNSAAVSGGGISKNYSTGKYTFKPDARLTRLKLTSMLYQLFAEDFDKGSNAGDSDKELYQRLSKFKDIPLKKFNTETAMDQYMDTERAKAGNRWDTYIPGDELSPAIFYTYQNGSISLIGDFTFLPVYAIAAMDSQRIITADSRGYYRPLAPVTRAELATILDRVYLLFEKKGVLQKYSNK